MGIGFSGFGGFGSGLLGIMGTVIPILVIGVFVLVIGRMIKEWHKNNKSPRLTVPVQVVTKRSSVSHHHHHHGTDSMHHMSTSTSYYVTFQVESGDRMELHVSSMDYGMIVEGDKGKLTFQGTRFIAFERD